MTDSPSITLKKDGPLVVKNIPSLTLSDGSVGAAKDTMYLCRCGHSANKPFCDGSHTKQDWAE